MKIDKKGHQDLVSEGDRNVELLVRAEIAAAFPDDGIVGEEHDSVVGTSGFTWVVDPIDGTANFVRGIPAWCVAIAVVQGPDTVVGVIHDPVHGEMYHAMRGGGAFINDTTISVAADADITDGSVGIGFSDRRTSQGIQDVIAGLIDDGGVFYRNASGALSLAYVACGKLLGYIEEHMNAWDCLAGQLIVAEAGGVVEDQDASMMIVDGGRVIAGAPGVWNDLLRISDKAITESIAGALEPQLAVAESIRARQKPVQSLDAWDFVIQAMAKIGEFSKSGSAEAISLLDRAIAIDPTYARAYSQKAWTIAWRVMQGWEITEYALPSAIDSARSALRMDPEDPWAYIALFFVAAIKRDGAKMISTARKAIELNPNFALAHSFLGVAYALTGNGSEAFQWIEKARRLSPRDVFRIEFDVHTSIAHFQTGDYESAAAFASKALEPKPDHLYPHLFLASSYAYMDALEDARNVVRKIIRLMPEYSLALAEEHCVFTTANERARFLDGLRKAGLPK